VTLADLPVVNATLNGLSAIFLGIGYAKIKSGNQEAHRKCMMAAFTTSTLFLISYITYHTYVGVVLHRGPTRFLKPGWFRPIYWTILITHTILAVVIVPLVILSLRYAFKGQFEAHKKITRWAWPMWMYVSVTGVVIYLLLYQVFPQ
jgi:uncharacterized membrane protein YozB (DUF420 family)